MRKKIYFLAIAIILASAPSLVSAKDTDPKKVTLTGEQKIRIQKITQRVEQIRSMDRSKLSKEQRKQLRNELKAMKKEAKAVGGGVYLSAGAIIIILLVLILIT